jgi:phosphate:Na+ symporter
MIPLLYVKMDGEPCFLALTDAITSGDAFAPVPENIGRHIASAHTLFNIVNVVIFLPFTNVIAALARLLVPAKEKDIEQQDSICHLEQRLLNTPSAALSQVFHALISMLEVAIDLTRKSVHSVTVIENAYPEEDINGIEDSIDRAQHSIIDYLVMLTRRNLNINQSNSIPIFMHCVNDIERIGDRSLNIYQLLPTMRSKNIAFSEQAVSELEEICEEISQMERRLARGLRENDMSEIQKVVSMSSEVKYMTARFERSHEARLQALDCTVEKGVVFVELLSNLERISAHITNVAERASDILPHSVSFQQEKKK